MQEWLQHPAFQAGVAPLAVAFVAGLALRGTRFAWIGIVAGYAVFIALTSGFQFDPLTAGRKVLLLALLAPIAGLALDTWGIGALAVVVSSLVAGGAAAWTFQSVLAQRAAQDAWLMGGGVALFVAVLVVLMLQMRSDGLRTGASGVGLGLAAGIAALHSASIGYFMAGIAIAAGAGAMLLVQIATRTQVVPGALGALSVAVPIGLGAGATFMLAQLPWYAMPALLLVPAAALWPSASEGGVLRRSFVVGTFALVAAAIPVLAAWFAARGTLS